MGRKKKPEEAEADQKAHIKNMVLAYESLVAINDTQRSRQQLIRDKQNFEICLSHIASLFIALHSSKIMKVKKVVFRGDKFLITHVRSVLVKNSNEVDTPIHEIKGKEYISPPILWEYFLIEDGAVKQCERIINEEIKTCTEVAEAIKQAISRQNTPIQPPSEETETHHQVIINQLKDQLETNADRIVAMCKLLPRNTKESFQSIMQTLFGMETVVFQAAVNSLLKATVLLETAHFYVIEDRAFAIQAVANFQRDEDMRSVLHKLKAIGENQ